MKERLTKRVGNGVQYDNGEYIITCYPENNNLNPVDKMAVKLCELEDKIESNTLTELPCALGDYVEWDNGLIKTLYCVRGYMCDDAGFRFVLDDFAPVINHRNITRTLTKEEAEKALAERSEGK